MAHARRSSKIAVQPIDVSAVDHVAPAQNAWPRPADTLDGAYLVSPARAQQAWLEAAMASGEAPKFSHRTRMALILGGSGALWLCIGVLIAMVVS